MILLAMVKPGVRRNTKSRTAATWIAFYECCGRTAQWTGHRYQAVLGRPCTSCCQTKRRLVEADTRAVAGWIGKWRVELKPIS